MKILSLSTVYPNPREPGLGLFVRARLQALARLAEIRVVAPVAAVDYSSPSGKRFHGRDVPFLRRDGDMETLHPRWLFPPFGTPANVFCLAARLLPTLARIRHRFPFDLIDVHFGYPEGVAGALLALAFHTPFVLTLRGSEPVFARHRFRRTLLAWALRRAAAVIAVSGDLARFAEDHGAAPGRVHTIPNGVDTSLFFPRDRRACRARLGIPPETSLIVCAGELIEAKGHHLAIRAIAELAASGHDIRLVIAGGVARGGNPFDRQLHSLIAESGAGAIVRLAGAVNRAEMAELLAAADVFTLPSFTEGCPNVVLEALACGTPVVASAVGGIPQMLCPGKHGLLVPPRDQQALTAALLHAIGTPWDRAAIARHGGARPWSVVAREVADVIRPLARTPSADTAEEALEMHNVSSTRN